MSTICQDVAVLTTTTVRTTSTVFVTVVNSQGVGKPTLSTLHSTVVSCSTAIAANSTVRRCASSTLMTIRTMTPAPTIIRVTSTITRQIYQTVLNTLYRPSCRTVPAPPTHPTTTTPTRPATPPPPPRTTTQPPPPPPPPTTNLPNQLTDTSYTTEYITVTTRPVDPPTTSSMSRTTVYGGLATPSDSPIIGAASPPWSSNNTPVGAITGGVIGGIALIILLGLLTYFLIYKKARQPLISNDQSRSYPKMQDQSDYDMYQGSTGQSQYMRNSDYIQPQGPNGQEFYPNSQLQGTQVWPQNMPSGPAVQAYAPAVAALPAGAAAAAVVGHRDPYDSFHRSSRRSTAPRREPHTSLYPTSVPYLGYAEPGGG